MGKIAEKFMFHFFSLNQKQQKEIYNYIIEKKYTIA